MSSRPLLSECAPQGRARLHLLEPFEERHAGPPDAGRADQADALFAQAADVLGPRACRNVRDAVAMRAGEAVEILRRPVGLTDAGVAARSSHAPPVISDQFSVTRR